MGQQREEVLTELRRLITHGQFVPGHLFSETDLMDRLGVSRSPIREALAVLSQEGIIEQLHRKGIMVRIISENETREVLRLRRSIEKVVVEELAISTAQDRLDGVEEVLQEMDAAADTHDVARFLDADTEFHCGLARRAGYSAAADMLRTLRDKVRIVGLDSLQRNQKLAEANQTHKELIAAIRENNNDLAQGILERHLDATARLLLREAQQNVSPEVAEIAELVNKARGFRHEDGRMTKAVDLLEQAVDIASRSDELNHELVQVLLELSATRRALRDFRTAEKHAAEALRNSVMNDNRAGEAWAHSELGRIAIDAAAHDSAGEPLGDVHGLDKASDLFQVLPSANAHRGWNYYNLALRARAQDDLEEAQHQAGRAYDALAEAEDSYGVAVALQFLGRLARLQSRPDEAHKLLNEATELARNRGFTPVLASAALEEGRLLRQNPEASREEADAKLRTALDLFSEMQNGPAMMEVQRELMPA